MAAPMGHLCGCKNIRYFHKIFHQKKLEVKLRCVARSFASRTESAATAEEKIVLPRKKKRDELSILRALASTVQTDTESPSYRYFDDPYLMPHTQVQKQNYDLATASGRKAAQYVIKNYPQFFVNRPMEDFSYTREVYKPKIVPKLAEDTLEGMQERIDMRKPILAYQSYQKLKEAGKEIPTEFIQDLLELLCYYNSEDPPAKQEVEEVYHEKLEQLLYNGEIMNTWHAHGLAEQLFQGMANPDSRAYCTVLRGRAKYGAFRAAIDLHNEMKQKNIKVSLEAYNAVLKSLTLKSQLEMWNHVLDVLKTMKAEGIEPNLYTCNNILQGLVHQRKWNKAPQCAMDVILEMKNCGIEPSLGTYHYLLDTFYHQKDERLPLLHEILDHLKDQELTVRHPADYDFFHAAMKKNAIYLSDLQLAYKIDNLANYGNNNILIGTSSRQTAYYTYFIRMVSMFDSVDKLMELYDRVTPHLYTLSFTSYTDMIKSIDLNDGYKYLPQIWSDLILFGYALRVDLIELFLPVMSRQKQDKELQGFYMKTVDYLLGKHQEHAHRADKYRKPFQLSGTMLGEMAIICCNSEEPERAWECFEMYFVKRHSISGFMKEKSLLQLADICIAEKNVKRAIDICTVMGDMVYPRLDQLVEKVKAELDLSEEQRSYLDDIL